MCVGPLQKVQIWLVGVESTIKIGIIEIIWHELCSLQRFIVNDRTLLLVSEVVFLEDSTKYLVVFWNYKL
jgi:hypothetical protein